MKMDESNVVFSCDRGRLLIADDEAPIRRVFAMILAAALPQLKIEQASNGLEAVRVFQESHPGIILMDLRMPEMDGLNAFLAIQEVCRQERRKMPSVIFCTGFIPPETVHEIVGDGKYHCLLQKPVRSDLIIESVNARLAMK